MRTFKLAVLALALTGCVHTRTVYLNRDCITHEQFQKLKDGEPPKVHSSLTGKADEDTRPLAASALELRLWGHALVDTLEVCSAPDTHKIADKILDEDTGTAG